MISSSDYIRGVWRTNHTRTTGEYTYFVPAHINREFALSNQIAVRSEQATRLIGELNAYSLIVPNVGYYIRMHVRKEAVQSSRIEGTYTDIDDAILSEEDVSPERRDEWREVHNYIRALDYAAERVNDLPLTLRLLNETHKILLEGTRGDGKSPGHIRTLQNWIGGVTPNSAIFIPPLAEMLPEYISDLEHFWHNQSIAMPKLIRVAVTHYQFETIHPYADGNGRVGRVLIILQLLYFRLMNKPTLYLSDFFERNRQNYYDALMRVRLHQDLDHWLMFFLDGVIESAESSKQKFERVLELRTQYAKRLLRLGRRAKRADDLLTSLYENPVVSVARASRILGISPSNANALISELVSEQILVEITGFSRNRLFVLDEYVQIFRS